MTSGQSPQRWFHQPKISLRVLLLVVPVVGLCLGWVGRIGFEQIYGSAFERKIARLVSGAETVPMVIGKWEGTEKPLDRTVLASFGMFVGISRTYVHAVTGDSVDVLVTFGEPGSISVRTPEAGYTLPYQITERGTTRVGAVGSTSTFSTRVYQSNRGIKADNVHAWWSYNPGTQWDAPVSPRHTYRDRQALTKLHLIRPNTSDCKEKDCDCPMHAFTELLIPVLNESLYGSRPFP